MMTNREFAHSNPVFIKACELAGLETTARQASRFRNEMGKAFTFKTTAQKELASEKKEDNN